MNQEVRKMSKIAAIAGLVIILIAGCNHQPRTSTLLKQYPLDDLAEIISTHEAVLDQSVSTDGNGSIKIVTSKGRSIPLAEVRNVSVEDAVLIYQARVKTEQVAGKVYLEMWCGFEGQGEFFSRDLQTPLSGTADWSTESTPFILRPGQRPDYIKLNVVTEGPGTVWVDDLKLFAREG